MLRIIVIYISSLYIHPCVNLTVYLSQSTLIGSRLSDAKRGWLNNTHGSVQSHLSPSEPVRRLLLVFWKNWGGGTCLLCPSSYTPVCKALCVCEAKQGWVQTAVRNYGKPNSAYCSSTNSHFVFEKLCSYSPGCIPCKVYAEDTLILTIDSIVICQTHAEDLRRRLLKMHPGLQCAYLWIHIVEYNLLYNWNFTAKWGLFLQYLQ
jgi:hypothetical protein